MPSSGSVLLFPGQHIAEENTEFSTNPVPHRIRDPTQPGIRDDAAAVRVLRRPVLASRPQLAGRPRRHVHVVEDERGLGRAPSPGSRARKRSEPAARNARVGWTSASTIPKPTKGTSTEEFAPYLFTAAGKKKGRLPTNVGLIPGGKTFRGMQVMSRDFNHYAFSSNNFIEGFFGGSTHPAIVFAPEGQTDGLGSAYDNNLTHARSQRHLETPGRRADPPGGIPDDRRKGDRLPRYLHRREPHPDGNARRSRARASWPTCSCASTTRSHTTSPKVIPRFRSG